MRGLQWHSMPIQTGDHTGNAWMTWLWRVMVLSSNATLLFHDCVGNVNSAASLEACVEELRARRKPAPNSRKPFLPNPKACHFGFFHSRTDPPVICYERLYLHPYLSFRADDRKLVHLGFDFAARALDHLRQTLFSFMALEDVRLVPQGALRVLLYDRWDAPYVHAPNSTAGNEVGGARRLINSAEVHQWLQVRFGGARPLASAGRGVTQRSACCMALAGQVLVGRPAPLRSHRRASYVLPDDGGAEL